MGILGERSRKKVGAGELEGAWRKGSRQNPRPGVLETSIKQFTYMEETQRFELRHEAPLPNVDFFSNKIYL